MPSTRYRINGKVIHDTHTGCDDAQNEAAIGIKWADAKRLLVTGEADACDHCFRDDVADELSA